VTYNVIETDKNIIKAWTNGVVLEEKAAQQLKNVRPHSRTTTLTRHISRAGMTSMLTDSAS
jgi:hypothetical protein